MSPLAPPPFRVSSFPGIRPRSNHGLSLLNKLPLQLLATLRFRREFWPLSAPLGTGASYVGWGRPAPRI
jgi:hypothetical protein